MLSSSTTTDLTHNSLKVITHPKEYELFSNKKRLMKKDLSISTTSMEDHHYHGGSSASIPFMWESQPGTPKVKLRESPLPPLTPPPSYCYSPISTPSSKKSSSSNVKSRKKTSKPNLMRTIFPKHNDCNGSSTNNTTRTRNNIFTSSPKKSLSSPSSSSSLSSSPKSSVSYYSSSVPSSPACTTSSKHRGRRWRMMSSSSPRRLSVDSRVNNCHDDENYEEYRHGSSPVSTLCFNGRSEASVRSRSGFYSSFIKVLLNHK